jgi:hypothetical protein
LRVYFAADAATKAKPLVCLPSPAPSRNEAAAQFAIWAKADPARLDQDAVDGLFSFLRDHYPCRAKK